MSKVIVITIHCGSEHLLLKTYYNVCRHLDKPWLRKYLIYDSSPSPCSGIHRDHPQILYLASRPKNGITRALNEATQIAYEGASPSDYITFVHSGDTILSVDDNKLESYLESIRNGAYVNPPIVFSGWYLGSERHSYELRRPRPELLAFGMHVSHLGTLIPACLCAANSKYDVAYRYAMDYKFFLHWIYVCKYASISLLDLFVVKVDDDGVSSLNSISSLFEVHRARNDLKLFNPVSRLMLLAFSILSNRFGFLLRHALGSRKASSLIALLKKALKFL